MLTAFDQIQNPTDFFNLYRQRVQNPTPALLPELKDLHFKLATIIKHDREEALAHLNVDDESAMDFTEIQTSVIFIEKIKVLYGKQLKDRGAQAIIDEMVEYLNIKIDSAKRDYQSTDTKERWNAKTALRALLDPAPKESSHPNYLLANSPLVYGAGKTFSARESLCLFWLAATDPDIQVEENIEKASAIIWEKEGIIRLLAEMRRANNLSPFELPTTGDIVDKLSCAPGVINRLANMFTYNQKLKAIKQSLRFPYQEFSARFSALIIKYFKQLPTSSQMDLIASYYYQVTQDEEDPENPVLHVFFDKLLSEQVILDFLNTLQAEFGKFDVNVFKIALVIFFEAWLENKSKMPFSLFSRLETLAKTSLAKKIYQKALDLCEFDLDLEKLFLQMQALKIEIFQQAFSEEKLFELQNNYLKLYADFQKKVTLIKRQVQVQYDGFIGEEAAAFQRKTQKIITFPLDAKWDYLPLWARKYAHSLQQLHQELMEFFYFTLYQSDNEAETEPPLSRLPHFIPTHSLNRELHDEIRLVKGYLYRHVLNPKALDLDGHLNSKSFIQIVPQKEAASIYFFDVTQRKEPNHRKMPLGKFRELAQEEQSYLKAIHDPMDILKKPFVALSDPLKARYIQQLELALQENINLVDKALALQNRSSKDALLENPLSNKLQTAIKAATTTKRSLHQGKYGMEELEKDLRGLFTHKKHPKTELK